MQRYSLGIIALYLVGLTLALTPSWLMAEKLCGGTSAQAIVQSATGPGIEDHVQLLETGRY